MMPNMDPRQMAKLMNQMGIKNTQIPSTKVVIYKEDGSTLVVENPNVMEITMSGQKSFQITGDVSEGAAGEKSEAGAEAASGPSEDDIALVAEQAKTTKEKAKAALEEADGDIAEAIMLLEKEG